MMRPKRVLFIDDDANLVEAMTRQARALGLEVHAAHNTLTGLRMIEQQEHDLICLDVNMPTGNGLSFGRMAAEMTAARRVPIVFLTGLTDPETRSACASLGAHYIPKRSDMWTRLKDLFCELLDLPSPSAASPSAASPFAADGDRDSRGSTNRNDALSDLPFPPLADVTRDSQAITDRIFELLGVTDALLEAPPLVEGGSDILRRLAPEANGSLAERDGVPDASEGFPGAASDAATNPWVLCVEDDRDFSLALQLRLQSRGISVIRAFEGVEGIQAALTKPAEAIILDYNLPNGRGDYVLRRLKANPLTQDIPVIVVSGQKTPGLEKEMLHLGAVRFFAKPVRFDEILEEVERRIGLAALKE